MSTAEIAQTAARAAARTRFVVNVHHLASGTTETYAIAPRLHAHAEHADDTAHTAHEIRAAHAPLVEPPSLRVALSALGCALRLLIVCVVLLLCRGTSRDTHAHVRGRR